MKYKNNLKLFITIILSNTIISGLISTCHAVACDELRTVEFSRQSKRLPTVDELMFGGAEAYQHGAFDIASACWIDALGMPGLYENARLYILGKLKEIGHGSANELLSKVSESIKQANGRVVRGDMKGAIDYYNSALCFANCVAKEEELDVFNCIYRSMGNAVSYCLRMFLNSPDLSKVKKIQMLQLMEHTLEIQETILFGIYSFSIIRSYFEIGLAYAVIEEMNYSAFTLEKARQKLNRSYNAWSIRRFLTGNVRRNEYNGLIPRKAAEFTLASIYG